MINETEERLLRILDLALSWNVDSYSVSFELPDIIATAVTGEARELQILLNEISDTFKLDDVQTNLTMYDGQLLKLYTYSFKTNFYVFAKKSAFSNSGVTKAFIHDGNSRMVNLFSNNDDMSFVVDASIPLSDPNYWQNLTGFKENELNVFNISLGSNALLTIDFMFLAPCVTHLMHQTDVLLSVLTARENLSLSVVKNMTNTTINFQNHQLEITFVGKPLRNSTDNYTVSIQCEECIGVADIVILFQISKDYKSLKADAKNLLEYIHRRYTAARIAMMTFGVNTTIISHFTYSAQVSKIDSMSFKPPYWSESNIDLALNDMVDYFETYGHNNSRRINIIYTDGLYSSMSNAQYHSTMRRMRSINLKTLILISNEKTHDTDEMKRWSDYPSRNFIWPASDVPQYIFDKMCKGNRNKDKIFNSYRFGHIIPYSLNEKAWDQSTNIQLKTIADNKITFKCNYLGTFSCNVFYIPPQTINFEKIIMNFNEKLAGSPYVLVTNITLLTIAVISVLVLRRFDIIDQKRWTYFPLYDNPKNATYSYFISIHTGIWSDRKLSSIPFFIVKGINGTTGTRALFDGNRENFNRLTYSNFLLKTNTSLGDLKEIKLWQSGRNASWHVEKILVFDGQKIYVFLCGDWLSTSKGDGKCYRKLYASKKDLNENNSLIHVISESKLFDDHLLLSLFSRPSFSRFSRVQRLICIFSILSMSMLCSAMWFQTDKGTKVLGISIGPIVINYKQFYVGLMSAVLTFPLSCLLSHLFRKRKFKGEQEDAVLRKLNKGYLPWWTIIIGYVISCFIILSGFTMTFFYSLEWENDISINWLMSFLFGTVEEIVFLNPSKVVLGSILIVCLCNSHAEEHVKEMALTSALIHNNKNVRHRTYMKVKYEFT
ncbi:uncharacterized protein [Mytilus edulis]|uniref:uncharacterized protein n=1 Tax=Mytilus edulis TaxID=6550 RepID=UPI0039EFC2B9